MILEYFISMYNIKYDTFWYNCSLATTGSFSFFFLKNVFQRVKNNGAKKNLRDHYFGSYMFSKFAILPMRGMLL